MVCIYAALLGCPMVLMAQKNSEQPQNRLLDSAAYRVVYLTTQRAEREHKPIVIADSMALEWGNRWSCYYDFNKVSRDSMRLKQKEYNLKNVTSISINKNAEDLEQKLRNNRDNMMIYDTEHNGEDYRIYRNREEGHMILTDKGPYAGPNTESFMMVEEDIRPEWEVTDETATVLGYDCIKAVTSFRGRTYLAWFAPELPTPEGPWKLYGLPGLILRARDAEGIFTFEAIGMENLHEPLPIEIKWKSRRKVSVTKGTLEQWYGLRNKSRANINVMYHNGNGAYTGYVMPNPINYADMETVR